MGVEVYLYSLLNLSDRWGWVIIATPQPLYPWQRPDTHCIRGWVGPRADLDVCGIPHLHWGMILQSPAHSKSLYWLHYPSPQHIWYVVLLKSEELCGSGAELCDHIHLSPTCHNELCIYCWFINSSYPNKQNSEQTKICEKGSFVSSVHISSVQLTLCNLAADVVINKTALLFKIICMELDVHKSFSETSIPYW